MTLSPSQAKAVTDTGVQLILAGPASGKTRVISEKILHLIQVAKPENILALTFSDKAAHEMLERLERNIIEKNSPPPSGSRVHTLILSHTKTKRESKRSMHSEITG